MKNVFNRVTCQDTRHLGEICNKIDIDIKILVSKQISPLHGQRNRFENLSNIEQIVWEIIDNLKNVELKQNN